MTYIEIMKYAESICPVGGIEDIAYNLHILQFEISNICQYGM